MPSPTFMEIQTGTRTASLKEFNGSLQAGLIPNLLHRVPPGLPHQADLPEVVDLEHQLAVWGPSVMDKLVYATAASRVSALMVFAVTKPVIGGKSDFTRDLYVSVLTIPVRCEGWSCSSSVPCQKPFNCVVGNCKA